MPYETAHKLAQARDWLAKTREADYTGDDVGEVIDDAIEAINSVIEQVSPSGLDRFYHIEVVAGGKQIHRRGFDEPACDVLDFKAGVGVLAFKVPGGSYFAGRGQQSYAGARHVIVKIRERKDDTDGRVIFKVQELGETPVRVKANERRDIALKGYLSHA